MSQYYLKDESGQKGPYSPQDLMNMNIRADTQVLQEGTDQWTTAGQVEELNSLLQASQPSVPTPAATTPPTEKVVSSPAAEEKPSAPVAAPAASATQAPAASGATKGKAWISWALSLIVLGGTGYWVYQDMEKNKTSTVVPVTSDTTGTQNMNNAGRETTPAPATTDTGAVSQTGDGVKEPVSTAPVTPGDTSSIVPTTAPDAAAAGKTEEEKKKQLALDLKKKEEEKKKQLALKKEMEMRNNWPKYITVGPLNYKEGDGIKAFDVPVNNSTGSVLNQVTLRLDYFKKDKKDVGSETLVLNNIPGKGSLSARAAGNKKATRVNVYITAVTSKGFHFCYPANNGNAADPYYCK